MTDPGYGPNGFFIPAVGKVSWQGNKPPITARDEPPRRWGLPVGSGSIPRKVFRDTNEVFRVKVA